MKKTNFFLLFIVAFVTGISLPNEIFADDTTGFIFRTILLTLSLLMYTIALYHKTENLMGTMTEKDTPIRVVHWVRLGAVLGLIIITISWIYLSGQKENFDALVARLYKTSFYSIITLLISTLFGIFVSNDIEMKKEKEKPPVE